jgi:hypothetical protein
MNNSLYRIYKHSKDGVNLRGDRKERVIRDCGLRKGMGHRAWGME